MHDVAIVGAGPAGMAAALQLARAGLSVVVFDEQARAGGQIFRRPPENFGARHGQYRPYRWARDLIENFEAHPLIDARFRRTVFGILRESEGKISIAVSDGQHGERVYARRLLLATGAYDMPVAFPGWTLPGVMTAGAVQSLLKSQKLLAGRRVVVAGSHPIQLILAAQLLEAGGDLAGMALARDLPGFLEMARTLPAVPGNVSIFAEALRAVAVIARHRVPLFRRTIISAVEQTQDGPLRVALRKIDAEWRPRGGGLEIKADVLALGYGFTPSTELARQVGCEMSWHSAGGGWTVEHGENFSTSVPEIFVAGEQTGVAGAGRARAEGLAVGQSIAASLGAAPNPRHVSRTQALLRSSGRFAGVMQTMFEPKRTALAELSREKNTIICRCEEVRSAHLEDALERNPFLTSVNAAKLECRSGMGVCQGRYCEGTVAARIATWRNDQIANAGHFNAHLPVKPVPLSTYSDLES